MSSPRYAPAREDGTKPERPEGYEVTHFLQHSPPSSAVALCGETDPVVDLNPVNGDINCPDCLALWNAGYRGPHTKGWGFARKWLCLAKARRRVSGASPEDVTNLKEYR